MYHAKVGITTAMIAMALSLCTLSARAAVPTPAAVAAAKAPAQHEALTKEYGAEAKSLEARDARHESLTKVYAAPGGKRWEIAQVRHCRCAAADFKAAAKELRALAAARETAVEVTSKGWSEGKDVIGHVRKFGVSVQRVRVPPGQSADPQAGNKPCDGGGDRGGDT